MAAAQSTFPLRPQEPILCPVCGGENDHDAVFCSCGKSLGDFKYVLEELRAETKWYESLASRVARFIGQPAYIIVHIVLVILWIILNTGALAGIDIFDQYPYSLLGLVLGIEAVFITGFLLIDDGREDAHANKLAELDYEVNVRTYRRLEDIDAKLEWIMTRLDRPDRLNDA
ncbi:MAG: DUF1003 domain-containing protein [Anaerolineae bacterium]|nr:DUF1003 domain-containing protein [Anaerolineae bacterium]